MIAGENMSDAVKERLSYVQGILLLLKETELFGPLIERALSDIDFVIKEME